MPGLQRTQAERNSACRPDPTYKIANRKSNTAPAIADGAGFVVNNGMLVIISRHIQTTQIQNPDPMRPTHYTLETKDYPHLYITVDINGANKHPNRWGWDVFTFELTNAGLITPGSIEMGTMTFVINDNHCDSSNITNKWNGLACAKEAVANPDYFKTLYKGH